MEGKSENKDRKAILKKVLRFIPAVVWMAFIYYSSSQTGDDVGSMMQIIQAVFPFIEDLNFMHFVTYFILAACFDFAFNDYSRKSKYKVLIVLLCVLYGITDEIHQSFVGGRTPDIVDIRNDGIGALIFVLMVQLPFIQKYWAKLYN